MTSIVSTNPSDTYIELGFVESTTESEIISIIEQAKKSQGKWADILLPERVLKLRELYSTFVLQKEEIAKSVSEEMGMPIKTTEEAIELANDTIYGLGAYVFTESLETFSYFAEHIKSGMIQMNTVNYCIPSDPFGGYKSSGSGREHGKWGFHEFCNVKVTSIPKK